MKNGSSTHIQGVDPAVKNRLEKFSHAIRTPLQTLRATADLLQETKPNYTQTVFISAMSEACESALRAVQDMLADFDLVANIESKSDPVKPGASEDHEDDYTPSTKTILVVDDNRVNLMLTKEMLERVGYVVKTAVDGREALDVYRSRPVSLILLDLEMPIMNGYQACSIIRKEEIRSETHVPIVALTATSDKEQVNKAYDSGFDGYVAKPVSRGDLLKVLKSMLVAK